MTLSTSKSTPTSLKQNVQSFGRNLSAMVMPNIGAFIAWGIITALFIPTGWLPNEELAKMVDPMITYLLPLLIGYTAGKNIYSVRGGVMGAIVTMGVIVGAGIPMFIGAMIMGPLGAYIIKKFDKLVEDKIPAGFEMLVNNFSIGILGSIVAMFGFKVIGPLVTVFTNGIGDAVGVIVNAGLLPLVSIFVEPAKILFLNNAINHGIFTPLGAEQVQLTGKSIFYLLEANPGPGLGILLAYAVFAKGSIKDSAPGAIIIHFFGGIHEIYFPYVLMNPALILAVIAGGSAGVFTLTLFGAGLSGPASPGSIIAILGMTPKGGYIGVLAGVLVATVVSFLVASIFVKRSADKITDEKLDEAKDKVNDMKTKSKNEINIGTITNIVYACDAGMGSSAMGATMLGKKLLKSGYNVPVKNYAINDIPKNASIVVSHEQLTDRAKSVSPNSYHISVKDFLDTNISDEIISLINKSGVVKSTQAFQTNTQTTNNELFTKSNIFQNLRSETKEDAIVRAGNLLVANGYVNEGYQDAMLAREKDLTTYIGKGVAIPHCVSSAKNLIIKSGIVILLYPDGVDFGSEKAYIVIGIAGVGDEHLSILSKLADIIDSGEVDRVIEISKSKNIGYVYDLFK